MKKLIMKILNQEVCEECGGVFSKGEMQVVECYSRDVYFCKAHGKPYDVIVGNINASRGFQDFIPYYPTVCYYKNLVEVNGNGEYLSGKMAKK